MYLGEMSRAQQIANIVFILGVIGAVIILYQLYNVYVVKRKCVQWNQQYSVLKGKMVDGRYCAKWE
jgi:DMSO reductase anchor subunit